MTCLRTFYGGGCAGLITDETCVAEERWTVGDDCRFGRFEVLERRQPNEPWPDHSVGRRRGGDLVAECVSLARGQGQDW